MNSVRPLTIFAWDYVDNMNISVDYLRILYLNIGVKLIFQASSSPLSVYYRISVNI